MDAPTYVVRSADRYLYSVEAWEFCYILNARQMGKSSLMVRMMRHLRRGSSVRRLMTRLGSEHHSCSVVQRINGGVMAEF